MIIVFSGVDGAGKSTQIDLLSSSIKQNNLTVYSIWSRGGYTPGFEFLKKALRTILGKKAIPSGKDGGRDKAMANPIVSKLWLMIAMLDLAFLYGVVLRVKLLMDGVVICDRYLGDTYLDFSLNFPNIDFETMWLWRLLIWITPRPNASFLFLLPVDESIRRSKLKNEPFPDSKEVLESRLSVYKTSDLFKGKNWIIINGVDSIEHSAGVIGKCVFNQLKVKDAS